MGDFKFWPAALAGVDLIRRRPLRTIGLMLVGLVVSVGLRLSLVLSLVFQIFPLSWGVPLDIMKFAPGAFCALLVVVVASIIGAAVMRTIATDTPRQCGARFGGDEARLAVLSLLLAPAALIVFATILVAAMIGVASNANVALRNGMMTSALAIGLIIVLILASRLCLAGPMAVRDGRLRLKESWRLTRSRRWKVFGVVLVATTLATTVGAIGTVGVDKAQRALAPFSLTVNASLLKSILDGFKPESLPSLVVSGLLVGLALILHAAPAAALHRALIGDRAGEQAAMFD